jgi:hypothetical protein
LPSQKTLTYQIQPAHRKRRLANPTDPDNHDKHYCRRGLLIVEETLQPRQLRLPVGEVH